MCEVVSLPASCTPVIDRGEHSDVCLLLLEGEMEATIGIEEIVAKLGTYVLESKQIVFADGVEL